MQILLCCYKTSLKLQNYKITKSLIYFQYSPALSDQMIPFTTFGSECTTWQPPSRFFAILSLRTCLLKIAGSNKDQSSPTFSSDLGFLCHKTGITTEPLHTRSPKSGGGGGVRLWSLFVAMWELAFDVPQDRECGYVRIHFNDTSRQVPLFNSSNTKWKCLPSNAPRFPKKEAVLVGGWQVLVRCV